ncbi:hypothetical protein WMY93_004864 [Mugilogobius chulae]|uniref:Ig-like domain-containing protein n=1 Tax=Mugilogobius chulae TaxID=88201 RepID=A0AAW0PSD4_9GOBI
MAASAQLVFLLLLPATVFYPTTATIHTLRYFHTSLSGIPNVPEFVSVVLVDDVQISHYDSDTKTCVSKQDWMDRVTQDDPRFWDKQTQDASDKQQREKEMFQTVKQRINVTQGVHTWQNLFGCEWDDETDEINGYDQYGFDGEDFIAFDFKTETFVAPQHESVITKWQESEEDCASGSECSAEDRAPLVSLLQKSSSSPVTCHATGFYPDPSMMFWTRDGDELSEGVDPGDILPNHDGTFQISVELDVSSVPPEDWDKYDCVFQLYGVQDDIITRLNRTNIRTNVMTTLQTTLGTTIETNGETRVPQ